MFPTLGLFASVRCPELSGGGIVCKRNPCLFSHTAPAPRQFTITSKRAISHVDSTDSESSSSEAKKPLKTRKEVSFSLFAAPADETDGRNGSTVASTSTSAGMSGTIPVGSLKAATFRKPAIEISRTGQVIRKHVPTPAPKLLSSAAGTSHVTSQSAPSAKGKERAAEMSPSTSGSLGPPRLPLNTKNSYFPIATRNVMLKSIYTEFVNVYRDLNPRTAAFRLAQEHALAQELSLYTKNNKFSYRNACIAAVARLKKRPPASDMDETGTLEDWDARNKAIEDEERSRLTKKKASLLAMDRKSMIAHDYVVDIPNEPGGTIPTEEGGTKTCERCASEYIVHGNLSEAEVNACTHHWGRLQAGPKGDRARQWSCCQNALGATGCTSGAHVFLEKSASDLHSRVEFIETASLPTVEGLKPLDIVAIDCELIYTTAGMALARVTLVDANGRTVLDEYIMPNGMIIDYVTRWSGITEGDLENKARMDLSQLRKRKLGRFIDEKTYIIGHGLENDLKALRLAHPAGRVIDTAQLYPHPRGLPFRNSLRNLARDHLKIFIQDRGAEGHSSAIDAKAALDLAKVRALKLA